MTHDQFIGQVQARARFGSNGEAERIIRITLETLGERLEHGIAENISAQLPPEIGRHLRTDAPFERMSLDQFFHRIHERENSEGHHRNVDLAEATYHARCVIEVLQEAISLGAVEKLRNQLPAEFEPLFEAGSQGRMRVHDTGDRNEAR
jgi:uncharacterized protein (DUF2267 family)